MKADNEMTSDEFTALRSALADRTMEYLSLYESLASDNGLAPSSIVAVHLGSQSTFNIISLAARDGGFIEEYLKFMYKLSKYMDENPSTNPYKDLTDS